MLSNIVYAYIRRGEKLGKILTTPKKAKEPHTLVVFEKFKWNSSGLQS